MILGRAEAFASRSGVWYSLLDGIGMGIGFTLALLALASIREVLGSGTIFNMPLIGEDGTPLLVFALSGSICRTGSYYRTDERT